MMTKTKNTLRIVFYTPFILLACLYVYGAFSAVNLPEHSLEQVRQLAANDVKKLPIVYSPQYNMSFMGLENLHPFDSQKYGRVFGFLADKNIIKNDNYYTSAYPANSILERVHSLKHLQELTKAANIARFTELGALSLLPDNTAYKTIMVPARFATAGSIMASELALKRGWAINLGGGYHHASAKRYQGFCALADVTLSIKHVLDNHKHIKKVMIIDLDAHQGNGHGSDFINDEDVYIVDMYNSLIYPNDTPAKQGIDYKVELSPYTEDKEYLALLKIALIESFNAFKPDMIFYVAGTDIVENDPLGHLSITANGVIKRDNLVFAKALSNNIPVVMMLAGGYQKNNAPIIADSIEQLIKTHKLQ